MVSTDSGRLGCVENRSVHRIQLPPYSFDEMVANQHFQRLKQIYRSGSPEPAGEQIAISYGRAELDGTIDGTQSDAIVDEMSHHRLLGDASALAAGSLEKERFVTAEEFTVDIVDSEYEGPVVASAEVVMVEPPRFVVQSALVDDSGNLVAEARGVYRPSEDELPPVPEPYGEESDSSSTPPPASVMPVYTTPYGILCLN